MIKKCPKCGSIWETLEDFLNAPDIFLQGYQSNFTNIEDGYYLFIHESKNCQTSFSIPVKEFLSLHKGPRYKQILQGTEKCESKCLNHKDLNPCAQECKFRYVRDIMSHFKKK